MSFRVKLPKPALTENQGRNKLMNRTRVAPPAIRSAVVQRAASKRNARAVPAWVRVAASAAVGIAAPHPEHVPAPVAASLPHCEHFIGLPLTE